MKITINDIRPELRKNAKRQMDTVHKDPKEHLTRLGKITKAMKLMPLKNLNCEKRTIAAPNSENMRICIFKGYARGGKTVGVLWLHGGGYVLGAPEMAGTTFVRELILHYNVVVVAPDYTLSYEKPYPAALEDAYAALRWMDENRESLGITADHYIAGGESAGGGLTAALCIYARDNGFDKIGLQLPLYPMLDDRETDSCRDNNAPVWTAQENKAAWELYLGDLYGKEDIPASAVPARETDFKGLPPALSFVGDIEAFHDETVTFFNSLKEAGIDARLLICEGCFHSFDTSCPKAEITKEAYEFMLSGIDEYMLKL